MCNVLELTYIRKNLFTAMPSLTVYPTALDEANNKAAPDHLLWFFPFYPAGRGSEGGQLRNEMALTVRRLQAESEANLGRRRIDELQRALSEAKQAGRVAAGTS